MAVNGIGSTMNRVSQKLSDTFLKRSNSALMEITSLTGNTRRAKSAVPGWYKRMSMGSTNATSDKQYVGMSPSSRFVTSYKNGSLARSTLKNNEIVPKQYLIQNLNSASRNLSDVPKSKAAPRTRSLPRWSAASELSESDRETDTENSTDFKMLRSHSSTCLDRSQEETKNHENALSSLETEYNKAEGLQEIEEALMYGAMRVPSIEDKYHDTALKRTVNINLNELDPAISDAKKTLSMDINVVVSVKPPETGANQEIGFQGKETKSESGRYAESKEKESLENLKITDNEEAENLKFGSEKRLFSKNDIIEEIGKVYDFLKTSNKTKPVTINNDPIKSNLVQNYDAVKKLYVNALGCVKACQDLKNYGSVQSNDSYSEFSAIINEVEGCFSGNPSISQGSQSKHFLGRATSDAMSRRMYSSKSDCDKAKKLPCLQSTDLYGADKGATDSKSVCEKLCMPCCKPARDPPRCFYPYHKVPCKKLRAPRPAFSECKQMFEMKAAQVCECILPRETRCKKPADSAKCDKK